MAKGKKGKKNQSWDDYDVEGADVAAPATDVPATAHNSTSPSSDPAAAAAAAPVPEPEPATTIAMTSVNPEDEWPEDDRKANKKGKKGANAKNKPTSNASAAASPPPVSSSSALPEPSAANNVDQLDAPASVNPEDEWPEDDRKTNKKGKKGGAKNKPTPAPTPAPASDPTPTPTPDPAQADVDPLAALADEWPEDQPKPKKGAGGAKKAAKPEPAAATAAVADANDDDIDKRPLSKKEKEKLRKQRQKEQEKAKLDEAKRALEAEEAKEAAKKDKAAAAAAAAGSGGKKKAKPGAPIAALQKMLAAQRAAEEEAARLAEEERKREEEEARRKEEEEKAKEEAKRVKKEKERLKREQLRKEGKLLTKAQKEAQQRAALKLQQLIEAGVVVPALQEKQAGEAGAAQDAPKKKKIVYENKKKKKPVPAAAAAGSEETPAAAGSKSVGDYKLQRQREKEEAAAKALEAAKVQAEADAAAAAAAKAKPSSKSAAAPESDKDDDDDDVKDAWDASSDEEEEQAPAEDEDVKDAWDASSGDEDEQEDEPENKKPKAAAAAKGKAPAAPAAKGKSHAAAESTDEDDSESGSGSDWDDSDSDDDSDSEDEETEQERKRREAEEARKREAIAKREARMQAALAARKKDDLRSPICCILGHVDTGKTKLLDKIRQTNVQEGEAGGITQQIGATYFPQDAIIKKTEVLKKQDLEIKVPGLLVIDTPGHESFTNLRSRGSSLCNIAILVVDIMHGLEPQTLESLNLLRQRKTPFIVALNKIDRIYGWDATPNGGFEASLAKQSKSVQKEYLDRLERTKLAFAEQGLNSEVYYKNRNMAKYVSLVPTSAITGEGIPDLLYLLCHLTQTRMSEKLMYVGELEATVLEVKVVEGLGTTIDVILSNGVLRENDRIVVCGLEGPIVTNVRALLTPQPLRELRVKSQYVHHKFIKAAMGVKISANGLEKAVAGSRLLVVTEDDDEELLKEEVMQDLANLEANIDKSGKGVWVQASTLGSLEALLSFLRDMKIPVSGINIGPVHKKDVVKASVMLDRAKEFAVMLCFDVKVEKEAQEMAEDVGVTVFTADIIYHLFDKFTAYHESLLEQKRKDAAPVAVFPCILSIIPGCVFNKRDPIIVGCDVKEGALRLGTPICVYGPPVAGVEGPGPLVKLGKVTGIEVNRKPVDIAKKGQYGGGVAVKIECPNYDTPKLVGRHFLEKEELMSHITRESIDVLKENFREEMSKEDWALVIKLKKRLNIQ